MGGGVHRGRRLPGRPVLLLALACGLAAGAGALPVEVVSALPAARGAFRVGIVELTGDDLSAEARVAAVTFPRLLYEHLAGIDERDLSEEELIAYASVRLGSAVLASTLSIQRTAIIRPNSR